MRATLCGEFGQSAVACLDWQAAEAAPPIHREISRFVTFSGEGVDRFQDMSTKRQKQVLVSAGGDATAASARQKPDETACANCIRKNCLLSIRKPLFQSSRTIGEHAVTALRFTRLATLAWAFALVAGFAPSAFAGIVYTMTNASGIQNGWALSGTVTVSGTGTGLGQNAITGWAYTVTKEGEASHAYTSNDSGAFVAAQGLLATSTQLIVPYYGGFGQKNFLDLVTGSGTDQVKWQIGEGRFYNDQPSYSANSSLTTFWNVTDISPNFFPSRTAAGWVIGTASAPVPEIDPAGIGSVLALVTGALGLLERRRLKTA